MAEQHDGRPSVRAGPEPPDQLPHRPAHPPTLFVAAATMGVAGVPVLAALTLLMALRPRPAIAVVLGVSLGVTLAASVVGQSIWARHPESLRFALWDLMAWNALRRMQAERRVERKVHLLGFDLEGRFAGHVRVPADQQLPIARDISKALEIKSTYSRNHSKRVERHARRIAAALVLSPEETEQLALAAALHDIGNIKISDELLRKPGRLTPEERESVEGHVLVGAAMAFTAGSSDVVAGVRHHHEHWDGTGYPSGLVGEEIPLFARIIAIAAAYSAMTSSRSYRRSFTREQALDIMRSHSGGQFDPTLVELFVSTVTEQRAAAFVPSVMGPVYAGREFVRSLRRVRGGPAAALVAGSAASVLLAAAIVAPGTFRMPSDYWSADATSIGKGSVVVELEADETETGSEDGAVEDGSPGASITAGGSGDVVLGTRFERDVDPPRGEPGPIPTDPGPVPDPDPTPDPGPTGPAVDPDLPEPGIDLPGKGRKGKGRGHAYGHDHGPTHPGQIHGNGHGNGNGNGNHNGHDKQDRGKGPKPGHGPDDLDLPDAVGSTGTPGAPDAVGHGTDKDKHKDRSGDGPVGSLLDRDGPK